MLKDSQIAIQALFILAYCLFMVVHFKKKKWIFSYAAACYWGRTFI